MLSIYLEYQKDLLNSWYAYSRLRDIAETCSDYGIYFNYIKIFNYIRYKFSLELWVRTFNKRALMYLEIGNYELSLRWYKMMLKYSWIINSATSEMTAYDGMSKWYYYLFELNKSKWINFMHY